MKLESWKDKDLIELNAIITCPQCGFTKSEQMSPDTWLFFISAQDEVRCFVLEQTSVAFNVHMRISIVRPNRGKNKIESTNRQIDRLVNQRDGVFHAVSLMN